MSQKVLLTKQNTLEKYLCCPKCKGALNYKKTQLNCTACGNHYEMIDGTIPNLVIGETKIDKAQKNTWDKHYLDKEYLKRSKIAFEETFQHYIIEQLTEAHPRFNSGNGKAFLEIGCGIGNLAEPLIKKGWFFIGLDFSEKQLITLKKRLKKEKIKDYLLIKADMRAIPIKSSKVKYAFGLGVIEHVKSYDTPIVVEEIYRVLKKGGISLNTIPMFNIGNLLYRSLWGGIPNIPVLKQIAETVHIKLLKERHMKFGYELQFTARQMKNIHKAAGFKANKITIDRFRHKVLMNKIRHEKLRIVLIRLCEESRAFWPMMKVMAEK